MALDYRGEGVTDDVLPSGLWGEAAENLDSLVQEICAHRTTVTAVEVGTVAGLAVIEQLQFTQAELLIRWWNTPNLLFSRFYAMIGLGLPILGFVAGISVDFAVFGGTAADLMNVSRFYAALSVGSLIFAVGIGIIHPRQRGLLNTLALLACLGASPLAASTGTFRSRFAEWLPALKKTEVDAEQRSARITGQITGLEDQIKSANYQIEHGGVGGKNMFKDGVKDNDQEAHDLLKSIEDSQRQISGLKSDRSAAEKEAERATKENPAQYAGAVIGGLYIFFWLAASQLVIGRVIEIGRDSVEKHRSVANQRMRRKMMARTFEQCDTSRVLGLARASVSEMLIRLDAILAKSGRARQTNFGALFDSAQFEEMQTVGVKLVLEAIRGQDAPDPSASSPSFAEAARAH